MTQAGSRAAWRPVEALASRRNVRTYRDDPIPQEALAQILEAGRRAPSAMNWQPWDFSSSPTGSSSASWRRSGGAPGTSPARPRRSSSGGAGPADDRLRPDRIRPRPGHDGDDAGRRGPRHRQRPRRSSPTRSAPASPRAPGRPHVRCRSRSAIPPTARCGPSAGRTAGRSTRSCTSASGDGRARPRCGRERAPRRPAHRRPADRGVGADARAMHLPRP